MLYALLLDRMELSRTNNWVEDDGTIFLIFKREDLADMLGICTTTMWRAIKQLKEVRLIEEKRQGLNKPNLIYIGKIDYSTPNENLVEEDNYSGIEIPTAKQIGDLKIKCQDIEKLKTNKTDNNKTENYIKTKEKNITEFNSS